MDTNYSFLALSQAIATSARPLNERDVCISVIVPCYNSESFIHPCLESLARQTLNQDRFEVICIDDFSSDNTTKCVTDYKGKIRNLRVISHDRNRKQGAARNTGLNTARGRFVLFLDSDDFLRVDALEVMLNLGQEVDVTVCQHLKVRFDMPFKRTVSNRHVTSTMALSALSNTIGWWPFGMLISRRLIEENAIRFREDVSFEDIDFNIRVFLASRSHSVTKEALYYYVERAGSTVTSMDEKKLTDSVSAISTVAQSLTGVASEAERKAFFTKASSWLLLQASRIRDCGAPGVERARLARSFTRDLHSSGLLKHLDPKFESEILKKAEEAPPKPASASAVSNFRYNPWPRDFASEFRGKVIFFCEVNYHIRSAAPIARHLKKLGVESIIIDASRSTSFTSNRPLADEELPLFADVDLRPFNVAETLPFATDAGAFVFMNDLTYTKRLIFENFGFGVPTFGFYEGINDDLNLDRKAPRRPYRSVDYILLPGIYQQAFYPDRECRIVGLPNVRARLKAPFVRARQRRAIINVNFTYGVLEDRRDAYVESAVRACQELGLDYVITQHPADKADLSRFNLGQKSVYELLEEGSILISRFSTTILEALAMGRPVVYHNPIGERVPKFHEPLGAYRISDSVESLKTALQHELDFVDAGGDMRARAAFFLHFHCHTGEAAEPEVLAARAIAEVLAEPQTRFSFKTGKGNFTQIPAIPGLKQRLDAVPEPAPREPSRPVAPDLTARLLLDPAATLPQIAPGGPLHQVAEALIARGGPEAEHFARIRDWACRRVAA